MAVDKKNILLTNITESMQYKSKGGRGGNKKIPDRDTASHAASIKNKYQSVIDRSLTQKQHAAIRLKGTYAEFSSKPQYELATNSLENLPQGVRLLNVKTSEDGQTKATVYIPEGKDAFFSDRIDEYANKTTSKGKPKYESLIASIEDINAVSPESFWTDKAEAIPEAAPVSCEIWLRYDSSKKLPWEKVEEEFHAVCDDYGIPVDKDIRILFPERIVKILTANREQLNIIISSCEYVTELRRAQEATSFFSQMSSRDQREWAQDLVTRCVFGDSGVSVCLLDAGINSNHPLIEPVILKNGINTVKQEWGVADNPSRGGHGTKMAGIAIYGDLQEKLENSDTIEIDHKIESVKILPKDGDNPRQLYGARTKDAVSIAEIENPDTKRIICMAVTDTDTFNQDGRPTSWSASLDEIASGAMEEGDNQRLVIVSAGNISMDSLKKAGYPNANTLGSVQNPAQSWNAVTVGGYSSRIDITEPTLHGFHAVAKRGELSPYSTTSALWRDIWPIKPEVLFDGGNVATNGSDYDSCDDLSLLTTGHRLISGQYSTICATSAASAQAANFCAKLYSEYPNLWPETIRALMVHSATWTDQMHDQFCPKGRKTNKTQRRKLLRHCGYGIPDLSKAIQCFDNSVNMIVEGELQPFTKEGSSKPKMNEANIHEFPWPMEILRDLGETEVELKVTLSYYIEPSPGEIGWKDRYKYPSCGLRFDVNRTNQTKDEFMRQISKAMANEDSPEKSSTNGNPNDWYLGVNNQKFGSIHSDFITASAVDLCESRYVAVYPVGGWWKERAYLGKSENKIRYSLIVSISTPDVNVDLYTPIINQIATMIMVS